MAPSGARPGRGESGGWARDDEAQSGSAWNNYMVWPPRGPTTRRDTWHHKLVMATWNVTSLAGKEPELVREVEWY